jgi:divalent metal cation (Fe/Co/Zn/Cd) transporter
MIRRNTNRIPTDAEFEAASKKMAEQMRSEKLIKDKIISRFREAGMLHNVYVWLSGDRCHVNLFVPMDADIDSNGAKALRENVIGLLSSNSEEEREITVDLDSHERVKRDFNGDYCKRFR